MARPGDRRPLIADHAIAMLADGGARALTHQAVDRDAGLAIGSTSYYFRTRDALVAAAVARIREHSRMAFEAAPLPEPLSVQTASAFIAEHLHSLATERREQALAVIALLPEVAKDSEHRDSLGRCLFSHELARELTIALGCDPSREIADDLVDLLTGRLISILFGLRPESGSKATTQATIERCLQAGIE
ncbi:TetR family transcriptional regulator [Hoyosella rhizosphaerae]|uniref:Transcriptional regulator, TetR family protein n=1 Tax=Hoyosella rhizosphaerae TaxID=1755582 RepID=A0A916XAI5_9ACTN|nr:TetR family transcriptional regulator [Hoyosella rhizosphaerae]MBN4926651.1 TetR family transcriptional regulator [Hoyosella rhizosphaerae]GGC57563.1 putative transcriptional regulator, TetR family protein [Hoyosella rhizosphaerae]